MDQASRNETGKYAPADQSCKQILEMQRPGFSSKPPTLTVHGSVVMAGVSGGV